MPLKVNGTTITTDLAVSVSWEWFWKYNVPSIITHAQLFHSPVTVNQKRMHIYNSNTCCRSPCINFGWAQIRDWLKCIVLLRKVRMGGSWFFLAGKIDISNSNFQKLCDNLIGRTKICATRSLFVTLCVHEKELYLLDGHLQLSKITKIISALCTVAL